MKVSIVTISFNQADFIEETILSVLNQSYPDIEYIVVDAGSTDGSREIIEKYCNHIDKIIFEPDKGPADGLNKGFRHATGEVLGFLNSDDTYEYGAIDFVVSSFKKMGTDIVYGNGYVIDKYSRKKRKVYSDYFSLSKYAAGAFNFVQASFFFTRNAFLEIGGFNPRNKTCWDGELLVDFALAGYKIKRINQFWSNFRLYENSITGSGRLNHEYIQDRLRIFSKIHNEKPHQIKPVSRSVYRFINLIQTPQKLFSNILFS